MQQVNNTHTHIQQQSLQLHCHSLIQTHTLFTMLTRTIYSPPVFFSSLRLHFPSTGSFFDARRLLESHLPWVSPCTSWGQGRHSGVFCCQNSLAGTRGSVWTDPVVRFSTPRLSQWFSFHKPCFPSGIFFRGKPIERVCWHLCLQLIAAKTAAHSTVILFRTSCERHRPILQIASSGSRDALARLADELFVCFIA